MQKIEILWNSINYIKEGALNIIELISMSQPKTIMAIVPFFKQLKILTHSSRYTISIDMNHI